MVLLIIRHAALITLLSHVYPTIIDNMWNPELDRHYTGFAHVA